MLASAGASGSIPLSTFHGRLKQVDAACLGDVFDVFFPMFRALNRRYSALDENVVEISARTARFLNRGGRVKALYG